ncbi:hypothetical protein LO763_04080 [Glycomyces sp. A-F 0318]|uniref:hypothetical protein n=1 Tax=Glycomyces amatae TaxID=2881355 RepID=UPI001E316445|nr:hypothetical protein [Glycomyces amatae]MCD0442801.1 hypothetical protein [Glycomyces amatae]
MSLGLPVAALLLAAMVVADFFVPVLPSATLIAALAGFLAGDAVLIAALIAWAALASWLGDLLGYRVLRRTRARMRRPIGPGEAVRLELKLRAALRRRPLGTTVAARFLPAGRTALAWTAVVTPDYPHARMSAVAAVAWACGMVGAGLLVGGVLGSGLVSAAVTACAVAAAGAVLGRRYKGAWPGARGRA